jgi:hypothetical protein
MQKRPAWLRCITPQTIVTQTVKRRQQFMSRAIAFKLEMG